MLAWGRRWLPSLLDVLIVGGMMIYAFAGLHLVPFHGDESSFIYISEDWHRIVHEHNITPIQYYAMPSREEAFLAGPPPGAPSGPPGAASGIWGPVVQLAEQPGWANPALPPWPEGFNPAAQTMRTTTGAVNGLTIGMALDIAGYNVDDLSGMWGWDIEDVSQWETNVRRGNKPDNDLLDVARIPSALFLALSVAVVYWITRRTAGMWMTGNGARAAGWAAVLIYTTTPAVLLNGRRAMQEGALLFFSVLTFLVGMAVLSEQLRPDVRWRRLVIRYLAFGVVSGIAVASKQTALLLIAPPFLTMTIAPRFRKSESPILRYDRRHAFNMTGMLVTGAVVSMFAQPVWWAVPHIVLLLGLAIICFACGAPEANRAVRIAQGIGAVAIAAVWLNEPRAPLDMMIRPLELYSQRRTIMEGQAKSNGRMEGLGEQAEQLAQELFFADGQYYESPTWAEFPVIQQQIDDYEGSGLAGRGGGLIWGGILISCIVAGLWALAHHPNGLVGLTVVSWWVQPALLLFGTNILPWQRYYVILHPAQAVIAGIGVGWVVYRITSGARLRKVAVLPAVLILVLAGCGGGEKVAPQLSAPPTRTPVPPTETPLPSEVGQAVVPTVPDNVQVISLNGAIQTFLTGAAEIGALDRVDLFMETVITPNPDCFVGSLWPDTQPLELLAGFNLNLPSVDLTVWGEVADAFPDETLIEQTHEGLSQAAALLPMDENPDAPLTICFMPAPVVTGFGGEPLFEPGTQSVGLGDSILMTCLGEIDICIERWAAQSAFDYALAYQYITAGRDGLEIPLLDFAIYFGRASDVARQIYPDASFPWDNALTPEQEADVWGRMQEYLETTYSDYPGYRNVDRFLYGSDNPARYPAWAGFYIGEQIVQAYGTAHPEVTPVELMALAPADLLTGSGYAPPPAP